jgi:uncharacterized protein DUF6496
MANRESPKQRATVRRVMHEFKHGELESARGGKIKNPKQAIAIALSEAGASNQQSEETNRERLRTTKRKEHAGQTVQAEAEGKRRASRTLREGAGAGRSTTRKALYAEAARRGVKGRSRMSKAELQAALR